MEDFTSFSVLLETWEAGFNYVASLRKPQDERNEPVPIIKIAKLLGTFKSPRGEGLIKQQNLLFHSKQTALDR